MASLRVRMAASYVLVTAAAVLVVEATMLALVLPKVLGDSAAVQSVRAQADRDARLVSAIAMKVRTAGRATQPADVLRLAGDDAASGTALGGATSVPGLKFVETDIDADRPVGGLFVFAALVNPDGSIVRSSAPQTYPRGAQIPVAIPPDLLGGGAARVQENGMIWAVSPVISKDALVPPPGPLPTDSAGKKRVERLVQEKRSPPEIIGAIYVQVPTAAVETDPFGAAEPFLLGGGVVLLLVLPVGVVFGLLSTRRLIRRVHRVADMTANVAAGDFRPRVAVTEGDEIGRLEDSVNRMAEQIGTAVETERRLAGAGARHAERARIARELHDSISQDLFSLSLLAGGLRRALPEDDRLRTQAAAMERTAGRTMREMQALLLELRPVALEDAGLVPALEELCRAYETRLGIRVEADLAEVRLDPPAEHAVLRVTQEALGNAVKHGDPRTIGVRLANGAADVTLEVSDDGRGFDPDRVADRHGMGLDLMRERVAELGGVFEVTSSPGQGTSVRVRLSARQA
jgi:signal transduction histidine kinase